MSDQRVVTVEIRAFGEPGKPTGPTEMHVECQKCPMSKNSKPQECFNAILLRRSQWQVMSMCIHAKTETLTQDGAMICGHGDAQQDHKITSTPPGLVNYHIHGQT